MGKLGGVSRRKEAMMIIKGACQACLMRAKNWRGSDPTCAFTSEGVFTPKNWNCATANQIRDIGDEDQDRPFWVDYQYCDDQKYAAINISGMDEERLDGTPLALWISWYKHRGGTDAMWLLSYAEAPRLPTEEECLAIVQWHRKRLALKQKEVLK